MVEINFNLMSVGNLEVCIIYKKQNDFGLNISTCFLISPNTSL
jgi:hypothetical protein